MRPERLIAIGVAVALVAATVAGCGNGFRRGASTKVESTPPLSKKEDPEKAAEINLGLGRGYLETGKTEIALEKLTKALELNPKLPAAHSLVAVVYEQIGDPAQAEMHYKRAVELQPKSGSMHNNYGAFLCHRGRYDEAEAQFRAALTDPFYETPEVALGNSATCAMSAGKMELAEQSFRAVIKRRPDDPNALLRMSALLFQKSDFLHARGFMQRYEILAEPSPESLELSMRIELKLGNAETAREYRDRLVAKFPDSDQAQRVGQAENTP